MNSNQALQKLSPKLPLTPDQAALVDQIIAFVKKHLAQNYPAVFSVYGEAGTGKSVLLSNLFDRLQLAARSKTGVLGGTSNWFLVNHPELLKVYKQIAGHFPELLKKNYQRPTSFINQLTKKHETADVVVVDEAHLLLSKPDHYNNFYYDNQLVEIIKRAKVVVLVFDPHQVLRMKSLWTTKRLQAITHQYPHVDYYLHQQFRLQAPAPLLTWFDNLAAGKINPIPEIDPTQYDFRVFGDAEAMRQAIVRRNQETGLSRVLSTSGYPSILDGGKHYIREGKFKMPWDQYNFTQTPWAEKPETIDEVGSIYTCQGFDLNYAGIIIGPPFYQEPGTDRLQVDLSKITDTEMFKRRQDLSDPQEKHQLEVAMVRNALNVLLKRGVHGTYLYAHDPRLRQTLLNYDRAKV